MKPTRDPSFKYTPSYKTDVRKTFERVRRRQLSELGTPAPVTPVNFASLVRKKAAGRN